MIVVCHGIQAGMVLKSAFACWSDFVYWATRRYRSGSETPVQKPRSWAKGIGFCRSFFNLVIIQGA